MPAPVAASLNWEQFMGAKLFAWIGGLAFFLGIAFFLKYSFEHNLIPPALRAAIGFFIGIGLAGGGFLLKSKESAVTSQTLCGTGLLILYAVTFACRAYYHFAFFGLVPTLLLMTLITAVAFFLAVRLDALAVAILGIAGGFLTPVLLNTGRDIPALLFSYVALLDIGLLAIAWRQRWKTLPILGAAGTILLQAAWVATFFMSENYFAGDKVLVAMAVFAGFEALFLAALAGVARTGEGARAFSIAAIALGAAAMASAFYFLWFPVFGARPVLLFSYVFLLDLGLLALAWIDRASLEAFASAIVFLFLGLWTGEYLTGGRLDAALAFYFVFALFHVAAPPLVARLRASRRLGAAPRPFLLLLIATLRLPLANPSPVFGLALAVVILLLGITVILSLDWLPAVGLGSALALEHTWYFLRFNPAHAAPPLVWFFLFYAVFSVFPFLFHRRFAGKSGPWAAAALAGPLHFYLIYRIVRAVYPIGVPGLLPAAFAIPSLLGLFFLVKRTPADSPARNAQLALFGGAALFFITAIFPVQFDREWITVGWALEGAALCWLFRRVPHPGLRFAGAGLLGASFARLALNPAVLSYHPRAATAIFNWYLYAYGFVIVSLFAGARLLPPPRREAFNAPACLYALGTVLAFLLLNIEIADYFGTPGEPSLTFQFSGNFARDMSYSIAWGLFALLLLIAGIRMRNAHVRYGGLGLLGVTVLKLFLHDLSELDQLYRIGALIAVAIIAILASFLYQRFLGLPDHLRESPPTPPPI